MRKNIFGIIIVISLILVSACAHYNDQNQKFDLQSGYRFDVLDRGPKNSDSLFVCLMFSGGGTRAAALSYGIMETLRDTAVRVDGQDKRLLDEVDCISSVSGGSFTAAYYGLFREKLFEDFKARFLERDIQWALASGLFNPANWFWLASPYYNRIDMAAELYDRDIFDTATFESLRNKGRPFVILNATNLGSDRRFEFTQEYFDALGSRLDSYKVSRAVAASSAFPYLLTPISLENFPVAQDYVLPWAYQEVLKKRENWMTPLYNAAKNFSVYLNKENRYIHLMDGGLSDNIGARSIMDAFDWGFIRTRINQGNIKQLVLIVVNARTQSEDQISREKAPPGFFKVAEKTATIAMDNYSYESVTKLREALYARVQTQKDDQALNALLAKNCPNAPRPIPFAADIDPYVIEINFEAADQVPGEDPRYYLNLPTSFNLSKEQVTKLVEIGPKLLKAAPQFQCLLKVLAAEAEGRPRPVECPVGAGIYK
jgi:NTE family protein